MGKQDNILNFHATTTGFMVWTDMVRQTTVLAFLKNDNKLNPRLWVWSHRAGNKII